MRLASVVREALSTAWAQRVASVIIAVVTASMCLTTLLTVGRTAAAEASVMERLDSAGSRTFSFADASQADFITHASVESIATMNVVERAIGVSTPFDVVNGAIGAGEPVPTWVITGSITDAVTLSAGRYPLPGEALISDAAMASLSLTHPVGWATSADGGQYPIVGSFRARPPFDTFGAGLITAALPSDDITTVHVVATTSDSADVVHRAVLSTLAPPSPNDVVAETPAVLADVQRVIAGDLGSFGRTLILGVLAGGGLLTAIIVLADVLLARSDIGRRRALGARRSDLVAIVVTRAAITAAAGAIIGTVAGAVAAAAAGHDVPFRFSLGVAVLATLTAGIAAIAPATAAAHQDPVRVLRTP